MTEAFICDAIRTPIGRYGGALSSVRADDLAAIPLTALMERNRGVDWGALEDVVYGCVNQAGEDNRNVARMALLLAGLPARVPGVTVNRLCASSLEARCAEPVHGHARNLDRQAREEEAHAGDVAVVLAGLVGAAENHVIDAVGGVVSASGSANLTGQPQFLLTSSRVTPGCRHTTVNS